MDTGISVVVPVYNPGDHLERTISSLLGQTLTDDAYEVIFVDDGSTDGAADRLDRLAADQPGLVRVEHISHSGWPGRPRNIGTDLARFDHVFYCDADDWLPDDALELMLDQARADHCDLLVPRTIGNQRAVPQVIFERGDFCATWRDTPAVFSNLTIHKLFRRDFLRDKGIRFSEGRIRLEDFVFMTQSYLQAERISVLGSRPCYVLERRPGSLTSTAADTDDYFASVETIIDVIDEFTEPGRDRDIAIDRTMRSEILAHVTGPGFLRRDEADRRAVFAKAQHLLRDRVPESALTRLNAVHRRRARAIIDGEQDLVEAWIRYDAAVRMESRFTAVQWTDDTTLQLEMDCALVRDGEVIRLTRADGRWYAPGPPDLEPDGPGLPAGVDITAELRPATVHVALRSRDISEQWRVQAQVEPAPSADSDGGLALQWQASAEIDFRTVADGRPLRSQVWDPHVQVSGFGFALGQRTGFTDDLLEPAIAVVDGRPVCAYLTRDSKLAIDLGAELRPLAVDLVRHQVGPATLGTDSISLPVDLVVSGSAPDLTLVMEPVGSPGTPPVRLPTTLRTDVQPARVQAELAPELSRASRWSMSLAAGDADPTPTGQDLVLPEGTVAGGSRLERRGLAGRPRRTSWRRRLVAIAERWGVFVARIGNRSLLISKGTGVSRSPLVRGASLLTHRSETATSVVPLSARAAVVATQWKQPPALHVAPLTAGVSVVATGTPNAPDVSRAPIIPGTWAVNVGNDRTPLVMPAGRHGALVTADGLTPRQALTQETDMMRRLGRLHLAWLLDQYRIDCVIDVGANTGQYGLELRENGYTGHIVSVEPVPHFADQVRRHAADDGNWTVHAVALGTEDGTVPIRVQRTFSSALPATEYGKRRFATLRDFAEDEPIDVALHRLDTVLDDWLAPVVAAGTPRPRVFLKMDTQGLDLQVFAGLGTRAQEIVGLQSEVALLLIYENMPRMPDALATYEAAGLELTGLYPVTREPDGRVIEYDCLMVRPSELPD